MRRTIFVLWIVTTASLTASTRGATESRICPGVGTSGGGPALTTGPPKTANGDASDVVATEVDGGDGWSERGRPQGPRKNVLARVAPRPACRISRRNPRSWLGTWGVFSSA